LCDDTWHEYLVTASTETPDAKRILPIVERLVKETHPDHSQQAVTLDSSLERDLGLDSLARAELLLRIGQATGAELPDAALSEAETPRDILRFLTRLPAPFSGTATPEPEAGNQILSGPAGTASVPDDVQSLVDVLEWHVNRQPDKLHVRLLYGDRQPEQAISYRDLLEAANRIAAGLAARGLQARQTVSLMLPTGQDYLASFFGIMLAGGIPVPIYPPARLAQIEDHLKRHTGILSNAGATLLITIREAKPVALMLQAAVPSLEAIATPDELARTGTVPPRFKAAREDTAFLQYTSGSTGDPKGVVLSHANLLANIRALGQAVRVTADDVFVSWLPLYHDMGLISAWLGSLYYGFPLVLMSPLAFLSQPVRWLQAITHHRGTISGAPNFAYELCLRNISDAALAGLDLSTWRFAFNGAEPVSPATLEAFARRFASCGLRREALTPVYGLAECSVGLAVSPSERGLHIDVIRREPFAHRQEAVPAKEGDTDTLQVPACGRPLPEHEIRIAGDAGEELPERHIGRLEFRGPSATTGYYRNPAATAELFHHGWLDSGDYAYMADGEIYITGRAKDLIIRGGRNFYPYELEEAIGRLRGIRKGCVAIFASRDAVAGTEKLVIVAETRTKDASGKNELRRRINEIALDIIGLPADDIVLAAPHSVLKTSSGKIRRAAIREAYERGEVGKLGYAPRFQTVRLIAASARARALLIARRVRSWGYGGYAWTVFSALALPVGALVAALQRPGLGRRIAFRAARTLFRLTALPISAKGIDRLPKQPHVLLVNHASFLDGILLTAILPPKPGYAFVAKRELAGQPLVHAMLGGLGTIFVERFDARQSANDLEQLVSALQQGENLLIFPEGTFSRAVGIKSFHSGAFVAAARANVPVVTAVLRGTREILRAETWLPHRTPVSFAIGQTVMPTGRDWSDIARMSMLTRKEMVSLSGEFDL
jgi:1-acyl-sn-glycerol-3-phosphate acyltransferase